MGQVIVGVALWLGGSAGSVSAGVAAAGVAGSGAALAVTAINVGIAVGSVVYQQQQQKKAKRAAARLRAQQAAALRNAQQRISDLKFEQPSFAASVGARDLTLMVRKSVVSRRIVYGRARVGGIWTYVETTGVSNEFLHLVLSLCEGPIESIESIYFNDEVVTLDSSGNGTGKWAGYVTVKQNLGTDTQTAFSDLTAASTKWTSAHRCRGVAQIYVKLKHNPDLFGQVPEISAVVKGRADVYDPRDESTGYSTNPALCLAHYLSQELTGPGIPYSSFDADALQTAADLCDEDVAVLSATGGGSTTVWTKGTQGSQIREDWTTVDNAVADLTGADAYMLANAPTSSTGGAVPPAGTAAGPLISRLRGMVHVTTGGSYVFRIVGAASLARMRLNHTAGDMDPGNFTAELSGSGSLTSAAVVLASGADYLAEFVHVAHTAGVGAGTFQYQRNGGAWENWLGTVDLIGVTVPTASTSPAGTEKRYSCQGAIDLGANVEDNRLLFAQAMAGDAWYSGGKWFVQAGAYLTPTFGITADMLAGPVQIANVPPRKSRANIVKGTFLSEDNRWQRFDFPAVRDEIGITRDGEIIEDLNLELVGSASQSQRLASIELQRAKFGRVVNLRCSLRALPSRNAGTILLTLPRYFPDGAVFRVAEWTFAVNDDATLGIEMQLVQADPEIYAWTTADERQAYIPPALSATGPQVAQPTFSPSGGAATTVTIATVTAAATIRYSLTSAPGDVTAGTEYTGPVSVASGQTLYARAFRSGYTMSNPTVAAYS